MLQELVSEGAATSIAIVFIGAALLGALSLYARQPLLIVYILLGMIIGPHGLGIVANAELLQEIGEFGIMFLLFIVGLDLPPNRLKRMFGSTVLVAVLSTLIFFTLGFLVMVAFGFTTSEAIIVGVASGFSSTLIGLKLLPTNVLHHRHTGDIVIGQLLIQDLIAIVALIVIGGFVVSEGAGGGNLAVRLGLAGVTAPILGLLAFAGVDRLIKPLFIKFGAISEVIDLIGIGWCFLVAFLATMIGLTPEIGAFIAGISLANLRVAQVEAERFRPIRDFFLVLFFFSIGSDINLFALIGHIFPVIALVLIFVVLKPLVFRLLLQMTSEKPDVSREIGFRLGQCGEFSLLVVHLAAGTALVSESASLILTGATVASLCVSTYLVVRRFPNPIAIDPGLRRD